MKNLKLIVAILTFSSGVLASQVEIPSFPFPLIPASAKSCLALRSNSLGTDVAPSYFKIYDIQIKNNSDKQLMVSTVKINIPGLNVTCEIAGEHLSALFGPVQEKEVIVEPNSVLVSDCPLYCGGIEAVESGKYEGTMKVYGLYTQDDNGDETPEKMETSLTIENF